MKEINEFEKFDMGDELIYTIFDDSVNLDESVVTSVS